MGAQWLLVGFIVLSSIGAKGLSASAGRAPTDERTTKPRTKVNESESGRAPFELSCIDGINSARQRTLSAFSLQEE